MLPVAFYQGAQAPSGQTIPRARGPAPEICTKIKQGRMTTPKSGKRGFWCRSASRTQLLNYSVHVL